MSIFIVVLICVSLASIMIYSIIQKKKYISLACVSCALIVIPFLLLLVGIKQVPMLFTGVILAIIWLLSDIFFILKGIFNKLKKN